MDALAYPWEVYLPKMQRWHHAGGAKPHVPEARFVFLDAHGTSLSVLERFRSLEGVWVDRATDADLESLARFPGLAVVRLRSPRITSLASLRRLPGLQALDLDDPPVLQGLGRLENLRCLAMNHFRRIESLAGLEGLSELRALHLSTIPSWDASGRCLQVESFDPIRGAVALESLALMGVWPLDGRLDALHGLAKLKFLHISHVYKFTLDQYASLRHALPGASGHCLEPYFELPQLNVRCKRCGGQLVFLTGSRPRTPRQLCRKCNERKLQEHVERWNAAVQSAPGRGG